MLSATRNLSKKILALKTELKEDIQAVFDRDPAARNTFEVLLTYPGVHALLMHRVAHRMWQHDKKSLARFICAHSLKRRTRRWRCSVPRAAARA